MKKRIVYLALILGLLVLSSCATQHYCPAYAQKTEYKK